MPRPPLDPGGAEASLELAPGRLLRLAEIALKAGDNRRVHSALGTLEQARSRLVDDQLVVLLRLASRAERPQLVAGTLKQVASRRSIGHPLALAVLQIAHELGDIELADAIERSLAGKMPNSTKTDFVARASLMRRGPGASLALRRRGTIGVGRTANSAAELGKALIAAGQSKLAQRYLRRCHRHWPNAPAIRHSLMMAYLKSGYPDEARKWLGSLEETERSRATEAMRLLLASDCGRTAEVHGILERQIAEGRRKAADMTFLRVLIALENLEEADNVARAIRSESGQTARTASHFGIQHMGALLGELRLYRRFHCRKETGPPSCEAIRSHFFAAKEVLDYWSHAHPWKDKTAYAASIPRRIVQYWNTQDIPPPVRDVMDSWRSAPGWRYERFDRRGAIEWLRETFGPEYVRAFKLANHVAEESDFLRLCLLLAGGGLYADADDMLVGSAEGLARFGPGMIVFVEPMLNSVANNIICAPKGHPILLKAVEMALTALLRRDNDSTWSKTGPGLLTRAVALHVAETPDGAVEDFTLVPRVYLNRYVHPHLRLPYKSTPSYWNSRATPAGDVVLSALRDIAASEPTSAR